ncbi:MAG: hypothetical protein ACYTGL_01000 [Planctomycetota bacterium]|jgi:hypothetical protein
MIDQHFRTSATPEYTERELVDRDTFVGLLTARRSLVRCDDSVAGYLGLLDNENGHWYVIREAAIED